VNTIASNGIELAQKAAHEASRRVGRLSVESPGSANRLNLALFTPVFLLAGIMYPLDGLPEAVRDVVVVSSHSPPWSRPSAAAWTGCRSPNFCAKAPSR
jgi:hypothetical protein